MYLLILGAIVFVLSQIKREGFSKPNGCSLLIYIVAGGLVFSYLLAMCQGGSSEHRTDGVYESATKKMDEGLPLNDREKKRVDDILNYKDNQRAKDIERQNGE
jgi:hypothetical protein